MMTGKNYKIISGGLFHPPPFLNPYLKKKRKKKPKSTLQKAAAAISDHTT